MLDFDRETERFSGACTACGLCVEACPIVPFTDIRAENPGDVMASVLAIYHHRTLDERARTRIRSCMGCLTCREHCPESLFPDLGLALAGTLLRDMGEPVPRAVSFLLPDAEFNLMKAVEAFQIAPGERPWLTDVKKQRPDPSKTVLFTGCSGIMQPDMISTALDIIRRFDPTVQALGGVDYCCGDTTLRAGNPRAAREHFERMMEGLSAFSPDDVVFLCPTCKMVLDESGPRTNWSGHFIMPFLAEHLDALGPFSQVNASVTVHDACHVVRCENPDPDSPRKLLKAVPGIRIVEMENSRERALCCGASAMASIGAPGAALRSRRLKEAERTGAEIMALYCPACLSIFSGERPNLPFEVDSVLALLGRSMGIVHEDRLLRYLRYRDPRRVLDEAEGCICASELPEERLRQFALRYFR